MDEIKVVPYIPDEDYDNPAMVVDFYEFTMANCLFLHGFKDTTLVFDMFFRKNPDNQGYSISAGQRKLTAQRREPAFLRGVRRADPRSAAQGPPRRAAVRGLPGGSRQGSARRQPLQPPRQQGQPVALKSGDGKIGESFGEGRRRGGSPRRMTEWERRGVEGGCPARFRQRPHQ